MLVILVPHPRANYISLSSKLVIMVSRAKQVPLIHEQTPLLASTAQDPINQVNDAEVPEEPESSLRADVRNIRANNNNHEHDSLPMGQILVLCISRLVDPISFFCIFPFLPKMVETMGIPEQNVGFYTGLIVSMNLRCLGKRAKKI